MMALDRGGSCKGVLYRLPAGTIEAEHEQAAAPRNGHGARRLPAALGQCATAERTAHAP